MVRPRKITLKKKVSLFFRSLCHGGNRAQLFMNAPMYPPTLLLLPTSRLIELPKETQLQAGRAKKVSAQPRAWGLPTKPTLLDNQGLESRPRRTPQPLLIS